MRFAYVNGSYVPYRSAAVHIDDRGYTLADGVYEVIRIQYGHWLDFDIHCQRLFYALDQLKIKAPTSKQALKLIIKEVARKNLVGDSGLIYIQVTRGTEPRNHTYSENLISNLVVTVKTIPPVSETLPAPIRLEPVPDIRWGRRDIKSIGLLPNVLAKQYAKDQGATEALLVLPTNIVTEGGSCNVFIVKNGTLFTHPADYSILNGVTRQRVLSLAEENKIPAYEQRFQLNNATDADEVFIASSSFIMKPVKQIGEDFIREAPGPITTELYNAFFKHLSSKKL